MSIFDKIKEMFKSEKQKQKERELAEQKCRQIAEKRRMNAFFAECERRAVERERNMSEEERILRSIHRHEISFENAIYSDDEKTGGPWNEENIIRICDLPEQGKSFVYTARYAHAAGSGGVDRENVSILTKTDCEDLIDLLGKTHKGKLHVINKFLINKRRKAMKTTVSLNKNIAVNMNLR